MATKTEILRDENLGGGRTCSCVGCGGIIQDRYIMQVSPDLKWHARCLKCVECQGGLDERCYMRSGKTYCREDYNRLFRPSCQQCREPIASSELVIRTRDLVFHVACFQCRTCSRRLQPGDEYCFREDGSVVCRADFDLYMEENGATVNSTPSAVKESGSFTPREVPSGPGALLDDSRGTGGDSDSERGGANSACHMVDSPHESSSGVSVDGSSSVGGCSSTHTTGGSQAAGGGGGSGGGGGGGGSGSGKPSGKNRQSKETKQTRVRTVLNEKQLHTLKTCYAANPRPDALMKEQLTEMTGLTSRVIRVWFQNKRCKDKKKQILMKQMEQQQNKNGGLQRPLQGMPMVASSPMRHDPNMNPTPVEVQQIPGPGTWKMPEFPSLAPELPPDHPPPFQQLTQSLADQYLRWHETTGPFAFHLPSGAGLHGFGVGATAGGPPPFGAFGPGGGLPGPPATGSASPDLLRRGPCRGGASPDGWSATGPEPQRQPVG